jgi:hypothetical protein
LSQLYLRRAGMTNVSEESAESRFDPKSDDPFLRLNADPLATVGSPLNPPPAPIPMFQRQSSTDPFGGSKRETPNHVDPFAGSTSFNGLPSAIAPTDVNKLGVGKPQLTYANVLRNPQLLRESNDPLTRIRNLGTQGNRDDDREGSGGSQPPKLFSYFGGGQW